MSDLFLLTEAQMRRIEPYFPSSHGVARVDDQRVISGIIFVIRNGLRWRDAPCEYGPHKTVYNRFVRWSRLGVFNKIFAELARKGGTPKRLMIDATHLKAHRTAASLLKKGLFPRRIGRTKGGLNSKLHAVCDGQGRPVIMLLSEGQMSDYKGAALRSMRCRPRSSCSATRATTPTGSARRSRSGVSRPASHRSPTAQSRSNMTAFSIANGTRSKIRSAGSRTGAHPHPLR